MPITTILSDLGNVVVHFDNNKAVRAFRALSGRSEAVVRRAFFGGKPSLVHRYCAGQLDSDEFRRAASRRLGLDFTISERAFLPAFADVFTKNEPVIDLWCRLWRKRYTVTAVSNIEEMRHRQLEKMGFLHTFDQILVSYEELLMKPSEEFLIRALDRSGAKPEEAVFIDDLPENLVPAAKLGITTHCYADFPGLCQFLRDNGVPAVD